MNVRDFLLPAGLAVLAAAVAISQNATTTTTPAAWAAPASTIAPAESSQPRQPAAALTKVDWTNYKTFTIDQHEASEAYSNIGKSYRSSAYIFQLSHDTEGCLKPFAIGAEAKCRIIPKGTSVNPKRNDGGFTLTCIADSREAQCLYMLSSDLATADPGYTIDLASIPPKTKHLLLDLIEYRRNMYTAAAAPIAPTTTITVDPAENVNGRLQIQFQRGASNGSYLQEVVSLRNTSGIDFASVAWDCSFYDKKGYKVGGGAAIFYLVRKLSITIDSMSFPLNGPIGLVEEITCELIRAEKATKENARLYQPGRQWHTISIDPSRSRQPFWNSDYDLQGNADAVRGDR